MADELRIGLSGLLRKAQMEGDAEFLKEGVRALSQALMEMEVEEHLGAARHECSPGRTGQLKRLPPEEPGHESGNRGALGPAGQGR
jgi:transposase-like protein